MFIPFEAAYRFAFTAVSGGKKSRSTVSFISVHSDISTPSQMRSRHRARVRSGLLGSEAVFAQGGNTEQFSQSRFVSLANRGLAVRLNPFGMFPAQCFTDRMLKLDVCVARARNG